MYTLFARISWVNLIGHVNKIDSQRRVSQVKVKVKQSCYRPGVVQRVP